MVKRRFRHGYTVADSKMVADCKEVTDTKVKSWLIRTCRSIYARPRLFNATNFVNYWEESRVSGPPVNRPPTPVELDFSNGEA
ncbi:hypothetical protein NCCP2716_14400 [Sporosarcina sp. NCCP-2716]|nr:hypothetical protein NCCP2716_14400 [Sporosarcina sp. NCCP-2716]